MRILQFLSALLLLLIQSKIALGDVFSAVAGMEVLVATESELVKHLDTYIQEEENRMKQLRGFLKEYESMNQEASVDASKYLANPINAYLLVKRLTSDWKKVEKVMSQNSGSGMYIRTFISIFLDINVLLLQRLSKTLPNIAACYCFHLMTI